MREMCFAKFVLIQVWSTKRKQNACDNLLIIFCTQKLWPWQKLASAYLLFIKYGQS